MDKSDVKILIVEDDKAFSAALKKALTEQSYQVFTTHNPTEAEQLKRGQDFQLTIIDCLLPKKSGVDFAIEMKAEGLLNEACILMSGIFKDKAFAKEAVAKTGAVEFLVKPFDLELFKTTIETHLAPILDDNLDPLQQLLTQVNPSPGQRTDVIKDIKSFHGYELPRLLAVALGAQHYLKGQLVLKDADGREAKIHFTDGKIVRVEHYSKESFFGALLVEKRLISKAELDETIQKPQGEQKRIGERLVDANLISPHIISVVNTEQMGIRLSSLVKDTMYECEFQSEATQELEGQFDRTYLSTLINESLSSKINAAWLKSFYTPWLDYQIEISTEASKNSFLSFGPITQFSALLQLSEPTNLHQLIEQYPQQEEIILKASYQLLCHGLFSFKSKAKVFDQSLIEQRLRKIADSHDSKNDFEILGVSKKAKPSDIKKAYHDLSKTFHPDKLTPEATPEVHELTQKIFARITTAYHRLSDDNKRTEYLKEIEVGQAAKILQAESVFEEGRSLLRMGQHKKALEKFRQANQLRVPTTEMKLYNVWVELVILNQEAVKPQDVLTKASEELQRVPPEDRRNHLYYFVKGLLDKVLGDNLAALDNINHALSLKPDFIEAKRELQLLNVAQKNQRNKSTNIFTADLQDVVGLLFKKKS